MHPLAKIAIDRVRKPLPMPWRENPWGRRWPANEPVLLDCSRRHMACVAPREKRSPGTIDVRLAARGRRAEPRNVSATRFFDMSPLAGLGIF